MTGLDRDPGEDAAARDAAFVLSLRERGVRDTAVLRAMEQVPRERFAPEHCRAHARRDIALPLPCGQSMTAPTVVAAMLSLLGVEPGMRVLEVGTGSGYVTALLARLGAGEVRSIERYAGLAEAARGRLAAAGVAARVEAGDGLAPRAGEGGEPGFDRILVNGSCPDLPEALCARLVPGGRLVGGLAAGHLPGQGARLVAAERDGAALSLRRGEGRVRLSPLAPGRARVL